MPLYDYECPYCGPKLNIWAKMHEMDLVCGCKAVMHRICAPTNIIPDIEPYLDGHMEQNPVYVKSRQHKAQLLKERGLVIK